MMIKSTLGVNLKKTCYPTVFQCGNNIIVTGVRFLTLAGMLY